MVKEQGKKSSGVAKKSYNGKSEGIATKALLNYPNGVAVSGSGEVFIADTYNHRVRKLTPNGNGYTISTVAGSGPVGEDNGGFGGDDGPATSAQLNSPSGIFVTDNGEVFIADSANDRVRRVDTNGTITTFAGNGTRGFGGDGGLATSAQLNSPFDVFVDGDDVFIADGDNNRVRRVDSNGIISTVAGGGPGGDGGLATNASLNRLLSVFVSGDELFISDSFNHRVRRVDASGIISTIAGTGASGSAGDGGIATDARLNNPSGIAVTDSGEVFIADFGNHRVRYVDANGNISTIAGNGNACSPTVDPCGDGGAATSARLTNPSGLFVADNGDVFIAEFANNRVRKLCVNALDC